MTDTEFMNDTTAWLEQRILRSVLRRCGLVWVVATVLAYGALLWRTELDGWVALCWATVLGELAVVVQLAVALSANPLSYVYLRKYVGAPPALVWQQGSRSDDPGDTELDELGLRWAARVCDSDAERSPVFDVFVHHRGRALCGVSRATGDLSFVTLVDDGRLVHTSAMLVPPHPWLVVNTADTPDPMAMWECHIEALRRLRSGGIFTVATPVEAFGHGLALEHDGYRRLGPMLGCFYNPGRSPLTPLTAAVSADDLLDVSLAA